MVLYCADINAKTLSGVQAMRKIPDLISECGLLMTHSINNFTVYI
jgi:hypothetical protein